MTVNILRNRMNHDIRPMVQRVLNIWAQKGIIHHNENAVLVCHGRYSSYINQAQCRVAWALDPDEFRLTIVGSGRTDQRGDF
jgi:hypothetical protein